MLSIKYLLSTSLILSLASPLLGCSSDASPAAANAGSDSGGSSGDAGTDSGGASSRAGANAGGASAGEGDDNAAGANDAGADNGGTNSAGASSGGGSAGGTSTAMGPCTYSVTGGDTFPVGDATFLCSGGSRVLQQKGMGDFDILVGAAFGTADMHTSTIACSLTSKVAPAAGDVWVLGPDHPGNCDLGYGQGMMASLWKSTSTPAGTGSSSIKFISAELKHGMYKPEDVYYLFEVELTGTLKGLTADTPDVTITGKFKITSLPLGA